MSFHQPPAMYVRDVTLYVANIKRSIQFYTEIIGLSVLKKADNYVTFTANGQDKLITLIEQKKTDRQIELTAGLYHFALLLPERTDLAKIVRHFMNIGLGFGSGDHLVSEAIYLNDPDGNGIEIYVDRDTSEWSWQNGEVEMTTAPVNINELISTISDEDAWTTIPPKTIMGHIHLQVNDLRENEQFYVDGLGFTIVSRYGNQALFISDAKYHHHIAFNTWAGRNLPKATDMMSGLKSYTIMLPNEEVLERIIYQLQTINVPVKEDSGQYYVNDPSNIIVNLTASP